ncbi:MAG: hypothetical protein SGI77_28060 [Pirellulaceae bacterium]|nr:hypothetical protein [Pirellulaceae bacterium]
MTQQFGSNCVLYFPPNRFEQPSWIHQGNLNIVPTFLEPETIQRETRRRIIQDSPLSVTKNWILEILLDKNIFNKVLKNVAGPNGTHTQIIVGYKGDAASIWNTINSFLKLVLRTQENVGLGVAKRGQRYMAILLDQKPVVHNIFQLSTGQTAILNIVLSILGSSAESVGQN